jgi:hypothetical protein
MTMSTISAIENADTTGKIDGIVDQEQEIRGIDLDISLSYSENAEALRRKDPNNWNLREMADILDAAEKRWFEIEG